MAKIVVADDHPLIVRQLRNRLEEDQHTVLTACDGEEALQLICDENPDLILLDVTMPQMDGFRVLHRVRDEPRLRNTLVVMLTGHTHPEDISLATHLGVDCYLTKPVDLEEVALIARRLLDTCPSPQFERFPLSPPLQQMAA